MQPRHHHQQSGQSTIEILIVLPLIALLIFGILEIAYLLHGKATVNAATFEAVRAGTLNNARLNPMKDAYAGTLSALVVRSDPSLAKGLLAKARVLAQISIPAAPRGSIEIISPTRAVFNLFKRNDKIEDGNRIVRREYVPNDNLMWRDSGTRTIGSGTRALTVNIQDTNLLKIRAMWCHKLVVPVLDRFIHWTYSLSNPSPLPQVPTTDQLRCDAYARVAGGGFYIPVTSSAIMRMQTPVFNDSLR